MSEEELYTHAKEIGAPFHLLKETARLKRLPVVTFAAGGIATPGELDRKEMVYWSDAHGAYLSLSLSLLSVQLRLANQPTPR